MSAVRVTKICPMQISFACEFLWILVLQACGVMAASTIKDLQNVQLFLPVFPKLILTRLIEILLLPADTDWVMWKRENSNQKTIKTVTRKSGGFSMPTFDGGAGDPSEIPPILLRTVRRRWNGVYPATRRGTGDKLGAWEAVQSRAPVLPLRCGL